MIFLCLAMTFDRTTASSNVDKQHVLLDFTGTRQPFAKDESQSYCGVLRENTMV
jgi:hypothetical protein